ncbi:MAG: fluoride efflux transporter FluC [Candidatus Puniceispirillales bacterium WSBS_2018_MAG_OTU23]
MFLAIALGGAVGAGCRYAASLAVISIFGAGYQPLATLFVNAAGSGVMGGAYALVGLGIGGDTMRGLIMVGFLGALTTFSSFTLDAVSLFEKGFMGLALGYVLASVAVSLLSFVLVMGAVRGL